MMTTMAALLGAVPIALGYGAGGEARQPLGLVVVGGLLFSQLVTLYLTPVVYTYGAAAELDEVATGRAIADARPRRQSDSGEEACSSCSVGCRMTTRTVQLAVAIATCVALRADPWRCGQETSCSSRAPARRRRLLCPAATSSVSRSCSTVGVSRRARSTARPGANLLARARQLQAAKKLQRSGQPDCETWKALGGDSAGADGHVLRRDGGRRRARSKESRRSWPIRRSSDALGYQYDGRVDRRAVSHVSRATGAVESRRADGRRQRRSRCRPSTPFDPDTKLARGRGGRRHQHPGFTRGVGAARDARGRHAGVLRAGVERQHARSAAAGRLEGDRRRLASGVPLQPGSVLGCEAEATKRPRSRPARTTRSASCGSR